MSRFAARWLEIGAASRCSRCLALRGLAVYEALFFVFALDRFEPVFFAAPERPAVFFAELDPRLAVVFLAVDPRFGVVFLAVDPRFAVVFFAVFFALALAPPELPDAARLLRVVAAFFAALDRLALDRLAWLFLPPLLADAVFSFLPRPDPLFLPPPVCLLTVAHARFSASSSETPRFS
jgi:hypothetical protein